MVTCRSVRSSSLGKTLMPSGGSAVSVVTSLYTRRMMCGGRFSTLEFWARMEKKNEQPEISGIKNSEDNRIVTLLVQGCQSLPVNYTLTRDASGRCAKASRPIDMRACLKGFAGGFPYSKPPKDRSLRRAWVH